MAKDTTRSSRYKRINGTQPGFDYYTQSELRFNKFTSAIGGGVIRGGNAQDPFDFQEVVKVPAQTISNPGEDTNVIPYSTFRFVEREIPNAFHENRSYNYKRNINSPSIVNTKTYKKPNKIGILYSRKPCNTIQELIHAPDRKIDWVIDADEARINRQTQAISSNNLPGNVIQYDAIENKFGVALNGKNISENFPIYFQKISNFHNWHNEDDYVTQWAVKNDETNTAGPTHTGLNTKQPRWVSWGILFPPDHKAIMVLENKVNEYFTALSYYSGYLGLEYWDSKLNWSPDGFYVLGHLSETGIANNPPTKTFQFWQNSNAQILALSSTAVMKNYNWIKNISYKDMNVYDPTAVGQPLTGAPYFTIGRYDSADFIQLFNTHQWRKCVDQLWTYMDFMENNNMVGSGLSAGSSKDFWTLHQFGVNLLQNAGQETSKFFHNEKESPMPDMQSGYLIKPALDNSIKTNFYGYHPEHRPDTIYSEGHDAMIPAAGVTSSYIHRFFTNLQESEYGALGNNTIYTHETYDHNLSESGIVSLIPHLFLGRTNFSYEKKYPMMMFVGGTDDAKPYGLPKPQVSYVTVESRFEQSVIFEEGETHTPWQGNYPSIPLVNGAVPNNHPSWRSYHQENSIFGETIENHLTKTRKIDSYLEIGEFHQPPEVAHEPFTEQNRFDNIRLDKELIYSFTNYAINETRNITIGRNLRSMFESLSVHPEVETFYIPTPAYYTRISDSQEAGQVEIQDTSGFAGFNSQALNLIYPLELGNYINENEDLKVYLANEKFTGYPDFFAHQMAKMGLQYYTSFLNAANTPYKIWLKPDQKLIIDQSNKLAVADTPGASNNFATRDPVTVKLNSFTPIPAFIYRSEDYSGNASFAKQNYGIQFQNQKDFFADSDFTKNSENYGITYKIDGSSVSAHEYWTAVKDGTFSSTAKIEILNPKIERPGRIFVSQNLMSGYVKPRGRISNRWNFILEIVPLNWKEPLLAEEFENIRRENWIESCTGYPAEAGQVVDSVFFRDLLR